MSRLWKSILIALLVVMAQSQIASAKPPTKGDILNLDAKWRAARKADDVKALSALMADDFIAIDHNGDTMSKSQFIKWVGSKKAHFVTWNAPSELKVHITGNTAVVTALSSLSGKFEMRGKVEELQLTALGTRTWVNTPQGWKLAVMQWVPVKQK